MKNFSVSRFLYMILGNLIMAVGIGLFKLTAFGTDPNTALAVAIGDRLEVDFAIIVYTLNIFFFIIEFLLGRKMIGIGTIFNWFLIGGIASLFVRFVNTFFVMPESVIIRGGLMLIAVLTLSLGCSLYQTANMGISPYDSMALILYNRSRIKFFWCRILTDALCVGLALLLGGMVGLGTIITMFFMGPFIGFFNMHISKKLMVVDCD